MCGIVGVFEYAAATGSVSEHVIIAMRDSLAHRGPDGEGLYVSPDQRVGLGHRRLSIVDLSGGAQPMYGLNGEVLVLNGEIYNYPALRRRLEGFGVRFTTNCDAEAVLRVYERDPENFLDDIVGMFAFALYDPRRRRLILARDRIGEKPLYWADTGGKIIFASEAKALLEHPALTATVDPDSVGPYLANLVVPSPHTLFGGVQKLSPGTVAVCDESGLRIRRYWELFAPREPSSIPFDESVREVRRLLDASVHDRLMSDVPVGVLLSGGLDSTTLVALLKDQARGLASFSVGFEHEPGIDERHEARWAAERFGTDHHEITVSEEAAIAFLPKLIHHQDEPLADPVCVPLDFVCRLAADCGVKVVLAGEGADELFWGYPGYSRLMARWRWIRLALAAPSFVRSAMARSWPRGHSPRMRDILDSVAAGRLLPLHAPLGLPRETRLAISGDKISASASGLGWLPSGGGVSSGESRLETVVFDTQEYEFGLRLPELLLMRIDRFSMANSVEARVPFLDPALVELAYRLPVHYRLAHGETKRVLRAAVRDVVPTEVMARKKQGFGAPIRTWFGGLMGDLLLSFSGQEALRGYFDVGQLAQTVERHRREGGQEFVLWPVLNFALWHKRWVEDQPLEPILQPILDKSRGRR